VGRTRAGVGGRLRTAACCWGPMPNPSRRCRRRTRAGRRRRGGTGPARPCGRSRGASPGPVPGPGKERLQVDGALQLVQPLDRRMVVGQPVAQHHDGLGARVDAGRLQGGGQRGDVADDLAADLGLADRLDELGRALCGRAGLAGWTANQPELVAGLLEGEQAGAGVGAGRGRQVCRLLQVGGDAGEVVLGEPVQRLAGPAAHGGMGQHADLTDPVAAPAEPLPHLGDPAHIVGMAPGPGGGQLDTAGLGEQQLQVRAQMTLDEAPGQQRPRLGAVQVDQPLRGRTTHPDAKVGVAGQEPLGGPQAGRPAGLGDHQGGDVLGVGIQQVHGHADPGRARGCQAHHAPARALAYSAASVSGDRWT
jgi:hypothetical protein